MAYGGRPLWSRSSNSTLAGRKAVYEAKWNREVAPDDGGIREMRSTQSDEGEEDAQNVWDEAIQATETAECRQIRS